MAPYTKVRAWLQSIVEPSSGVSGVVERRRARVLITMVLAIVPLGLVTVTVQLLTRPDFFPTFVTNTIALLLIGFLGWLGRTRYYRPAAGGAVLVIVGTCAAAGLADPNDPVWWAYTTLAILLATLLISIRGASLVAVAAIAATLAVGLINGSPVEQMIAPLMFQVVVFPVLLVLAHYRNVLELDRQEAQRALQDKLHESQRLETLGRVAGGIAHDFNNLLMVVMSSSRLAREAKADDVIFDEIDAACERGRLLTQQLLAFSRRQVLAPSRLRLDEAVVNAEPILARLVGREKLVVTSEVEGGAAILADRSQIEQVLLNLVVNADAATRPDGRIELRVGVVEAGPTDTALEDQRCVYLVVADDGGGIAPDVRAHMFEPFFTTKGDDGGTGLGLATVYGIVNQSGGHIEVDSAPGEGTTLRNPPRERYRRHVAAAEKSCERVTTTSVANDPPRATLCHHRHMEGLPLRVTGRGVHVARLTVARVARLTVARVA